MSLELHVWGRAFGLPSVDPECLAAITFLRAALPSDAQWQLVDSNDPASNPTNHLPALQCNGTWVSGYGPIVRHLTSRSLCADLDAALPASHRAGLVAYGAYLRAHAAPLLDLSLYVSAANWAAATRPAYSALLPFPLTWTVPTLVRTEAIARAAHLGLAELDSDFDPSSGLHLSTGRDALPETFRRHIPMQSRRTVREEMTPEQATAIRLCGLTEDCLSTIEGFMVAPDGGGDDDRPRFFHGQTPTSFDCLAYGYLALMRDAPVPRSFLREWLLEKTPRLSTFVDDMSSTCFQAAGHLPWHRPQPTMGATIRRVLDTTVRHIPSLGDYYADELRAHAERGARSPSGRTLAVLLSLVMTGAALGYGVYLHKTLQPFGSRFQTWRARRDGSKLSDFGQVGAMLTSAMGGAQSAFGAGGVANASTEAHFVETDTEVD